MTVDEDFEELLRRRFQDEAPAVGTSPGLASRLIADGSVEVRRRHRRVVAWTAAMSVALVAGMGVVMPRLIGAEPQREPEHTPATNRTNGPDGARFPVATWASELPRGEDPAVAYVAGTAVTLANGRTVDLSAIAWGRDLETTGGEIIGQTVAGLVLLAEASEVRSGFFDSRYVLVEDDGDVIDMPVSTRTAGAAQEAVVSPDGRYFTNGGPVIDKQTNAIIAEMPEEAEYLHAWTPAGVIYSDDGSDFSLWRVGSTPIPIGGRNPGQYENGTDIGLRRSDGCTEVVRISPDGSIAPETTECLPSMFTVSPDGSHGLTIDFHVVDTETGTKTAIADQQLGEIPRFAAAFWEGADSVLIPVPGPRTGTERLIRCNVRSVSCERATGPIDAGSYDGVDLP